MAVSDLEGRSRQLWAGPSLFKNSRPAPLYHGPPRLRRSVRSLGAERSMPRRHRCRHAAGLCSGKHTSLLSSQQPKRELPASKPCNSSTLQVCAAPPDVCVHISPWDSGCCRENFSCHQLRTRTQEPPAIVSAQHPRDTGGCGQTQERTAVMAGSSAGGIPTASPLSHRTNELSLPSSQSIGSNCLDPAQVLCSQMHT